MNKFAALLLCLMLAMLPVSALAEPVAQVTLLPTPPPAPSGTFDTPSLATPTVFAQPAAVPATATSVKIWGQELAPGSYYVNGDGGIQGSVYSYEPAEWHAHYDAATGILTLKNLNVVRSTAEPGGVTCGIYADGSIIAVLTGSSSVSASNAARSCAVFVNGSLTVRDTGSLLAEGGISSVSGNDAGSYGVYTADDINIGGARLTAKGNTVTGMATSCGVFVSDGNIRVSSGELKAHGGSAQTVSYGLYAGAGTAGNGNVTLSGGTLYVAGGQSADTSSGAAVLGILTVSGGTLTAATGAAPRSYGLFVLGSTSDISGGAVTATAGTADVNSYGVFANGALAVSDSGELNCTGGTVTAKAGTATVNSYGVFAGSALTVSDSGKLNGTGGAVNGTTGVIVENSYGVVAYGAVTVSDSGELNGRGGAVTGAAGATDVNSYGVFTGGVLTISGSGEFNGTGGAVTANNVGRSYGIFAIEILTSGGSVTATGGKVTGTGTATGHSCGAYTYGDGIEVTGGTLSAQGDEARESLGVWTYSNVSTGGNITVLDGTLTGTGGTGKAIGYGVFTDGTLTVSGGAVTGTGGTSRDISIGLCIGGTSDISAGTVTGTGGTATASCGVVTDGALTASGGRLTAEAADAGTNKYAISPAPVLRYASGYYWRTSNTADYTSSAVTQYAWASRQTYVDICESLPDLPGILISIPIFREGKAPENETITVTHGADFRADNYFDSARLDSTELDLGVIGGREGVHGSVRNGSIVIHLKKSYLDTLSAGTHTLTVNLKNEFASRPVTADIRINAAPTPPAPVPPYNPPTGDDANVAAWTAAAILAAGVVIIALRKAAVRKS